jgi:hypothetical protein
MPDLWLQVGMQSVVPQTRQLDRGFLSSSFVLNQLLTSHTHYTLYRMLLMRLSGYCHPNIWILASKYRLHVIVIIMKIHPQYSRANARIKIRPENSNCPCSFLCCILKIQSTFHLLLLTLSVLYLASNMIVPDGRAGTPWELW